jgi:hypothetical protein
MIANAASEDRLVEAVNAQNTRAGGDRTYHLVISLHPEDRTSTSTERRQRSARRSSCDYGKTEAQ